MVPNLPMEWGRMDLLHTGLLACQYTELNPMSVFISHCRQRGKPQSHKWNAMSRLDCVIFGETWPAIHCNFCRGLPLLRKEIIWCFHYYSRPFKGTCQQPYQEIQCQLACRPQQGNTGSENGNAGGGSMYGGYQSGGYGQPQGNGQNSNAGGGGNGGGVYGRPAYGQPQGQGQAQPSNRGTYL